MITFVKEFEQYLLSENRAEALHSIIPGSQSDLYIQLSEAIKQLTKENKLPGNIWTVLQQFKEKVSIDVYNENKLVIILREYDLDVTTEARKKEIIKEIREMFYHHIADFNYTKPHNIQNTVLDDEYSTTKYPNVLDGKIFELEYLVEEYLKTPTEVNILKEIREDYLYPAIKKVFNKLPEKFFEEWLFKAGFILPTYLLSKENLDIVSLFINKYCDCNKHSIDLAHLYSGMTVEQIQFLSGQITSKYFDMNELINQTISKKFSSKLNPSASNSEKNQVLIEIYEMIRNKPANYNAFKASVLLEILEKEDLLNTYDLKLFLEYLKNPSTVSSIYKLSGEKYKTISTQRQYNIWGNNKLPKENQVILSHLRHFFLKENVQLEVFSDYFEANYLKREYLKSRLLLGEESGEYIKYFGNVDYENLINKTEITICQYNKPIFDVDEPVILHVDIKNIQTLFVKVFEINTENYYYSKKSPINTALSLEGLITTKESTYSYSEKPQRLVSKIFELTEIQNKRGLYIVEFIGNGYSSRAVIKKGRLSLVSRSTAVGKMLFILDENSEICKSSRTGVWFLDKFYNCDTNTGHISIPYMKQNYNEPCIIVHEDFAELTNLEVTEEVYELRGAFHINNESLMLGNTAKVIFKPFLYINGIETGVEYLKDSKITAKLTKLENEASIPIINSFDKLFINRKKEIEIELQIPPKLIDIELVFEAEVKNKSKDKYDILKFSEIIQLNSFEEDKQFSKLFLRKVSESYIVSLLGKNGEAKANAQINFNFELKTTSKNFTAILQTDSKGEVNLGKLENVAMLNARTNCMDKEISMQWIVPKTFQFLYPNSIDITEGGKISLPYDNTELVQNNISLVRMRKGEVIENCFDMIKIISVNSDNTRFKISIENLPEGTYHLKFINSKHIVSIAVHKGKIWNNTNFIITQNEIIENTQIRHPISVNSISVVHQSENEETLSDIKIKLGAHTPFARIHLYAYQFLPSDTNDFFKKVKSIFDSAQLNTVHSFDNWENIYLSNRLLNEEIQYVFDRKYLERFIGNSLEKPSLLLKRKFVRETTTEEEIINEGTDYISDDVKIQKMSACKKKKRAIQEKIKKNYYSDFHNFLANAPLVIANITPNDSGEVIIKNLPLSEFSHIQIVALDKQSIYDEILSLPAKEIQKRNLTLVTPLNPEKTYSEMRKIEFYDNSSSVEIADITSTDFKLIDSLEKVVNYNLIVNQKLRPDWEKFSFLFKLNQMEEEDLKKNISNYFSHELNIFCYFKFPDLFEEYIRPVINYKCEKTFIDFFLLNDVENLTKFTRPDSLSKLNSFEKSLLVLALGNSTPNLANNIKKLLYSIAEKNKLKGQDIKKLFNIMMNMKITEDNSYDMQERIKHISSGTSQLETINMAPMLTNQYALFSPGVGMNNPNENRRESRVRQFRSKMANNQIENCLMEMECEDYSNKESLREDIFEYAENEECESGNAMLQNAKNNLYTNPGKSEEYQETHYYFSNNADILEINNLFWYDFVGHITSKDSIKNFLSKNLLIPANTVIELIFMLSVLDLPLTSSLHQYERKEGRALQINPSSNLVLFTKEIGEAKSNINSKLMISQNVIDIANENNPDQVQVKEFLLNKVYVHETIVTNISHSKLSFELIIQIPVGSIPVINSEYTKTVHLQLDKFDTTNYKTYFYFPEQTGKFIQYPPNIAINGIVVAKGEPLIYEVVKCVTFQSKENLDNILITGSKNDILEFFRKCDNIKTDQVNKILWLLKEKDFFKEFLNILRNKGVFFEFVWYFGFFHQDHSSVRDILDIDRRIKQAVGPKFTSSLLKVDETNNFDVKFHLDYHPIFNARVHRLGQNNQTILNKELRETYENFVIYMLRLSEKEIDSKCYIRLCYYLILQDRIEEALKIFTRIDTTEFNTNSSLLMQYDYIAAYLDFSIGYPDFQIAKDICVKYKNFPLAHWRDLFEEIEDQLIEYEGKEICSDIDLTLDEEKKKKQMVKDAVQSMPSLGFTIEQKSTLNISYSNLDEIWIKFYLIDLEILFSRTPFISSNLDDFSYVQPNYVKKIQLDNLSKEKQTDYLFSIPEEFLCKNLFIEVSSLNKKVFDTYFSTQLKVFITENLGEVKVTDLSNKQLNKVYVKVFAKMKDDSVKFYKDGYTDLRGKFNYILLNTDQLKSVTKFAVFIMHDVFGSVIKECNPPDNILRDANNSTSDYDNFDNYRKQAREVWRKKNKC